MASHTDTRPNGPLNIFKHVSISKVAQVLKHAHVITTVHCVADIRLKSDAGDVPVTVFDTYANAVTLFIS